MIATHFREYFLFGLFFALVTPLQVLWAGLIVRSPLDRRLLMAGLFGSLAIAGLWTFSRVFGLPIGPDAFKPEAVGAKDLLATYAELGVVVLTWMCLRRREPAASAWVLVPAWTLAVAGLFAAFLAGH